MVGNWWWHLRLCWGYMISLIARYFHTYNTYLHMSVCAHLSMNKSKRIQIIIRNQLTRYFMLQSCKIVLGKILPCVTPSYLSAIEFLWSLEFHTEGITRLFYLSPIYKTEYQNNFSLINRHDIKYIPWSSIFFFYTSAAGRKIIFDLPK